MPCARKECKTPVVRVGRIIPAHVGGGIDELQATTSQALEVLENIAETEHHLPDLMDFAKPVFADIASRHVFCHLLGVLLEPEKGKTLCPSYTTTRQESLRARAPRELYAC